MVCKISNNKSTTLVTCCLIVVVLAASVVSAQEQSSSGFGLASIPGAKTATGILASSTDGMSRYLAPDGPIQPALTAIGGLPMRGVELVNNGITRISSGLDSGAQSLANSAGNDGTIRMPGLDTAESMMPSSVAGLGTMMHSAIQSKNQFIAGQAERGVQAGERLRSMMQNGLHGMQARSSKNMGDMGKMVSSVQDTLMKSSNQLKMQVRQSMSGAMDRMQGMQRIGQNMRGQVQGIQQTLTNGLSGTMEQLQRTGQQLQGQIQSGLQQNMGSMSGLMSSMQGGMSGIGKNLQGNLQGALQHAQNAAQQVHSHIQQAASGPLSMLQNMGSSLGNMMNVKSSQMSSSPKGKAKY